VPPAAPDHAQASFRAMGDDVVAVLRELGHARFAVVGHDRGARVTHRSRSTIRPRSSGPRSSTSSRP
jgi:hypothetical protein